MSLYVKEITFSSPSCTYFIAKCDSIESLQTCIESSIWACKERQSAPQPRVLLEEALSSGQVILIFSVSSQRGWHGFCKVIQISSTQQKSTRRIETNNKPESDAWYRFPVSWQLNFQEFGTHVCLPFSLTQDIFSDSEIPVNQVRNWHKLSNEQGEKLCSMMNSYHQSLTAQQALKHAELSRKADSFFEKELKSYGGNHEYDNFVWGAVMQKVKKDLGKILLACPFGSQRYNLSCEESDHDIFIVYQAKTKEYLSLDPPKQTIKNSDKEEVDYTVIEVQRYCELLLSGDPRCVETLYLDDNKGLSYATSEWRKLQTFKTSFLTKECLNKYLREAQGSNGLKQLYKWKNYNADTDSLPSKLNKLSYIVLRLLENARDLVVHNELNVYRATDSKEKQLLIDVKKGNYGFSAVVDIATRHLEDIEKTTTVLPADSSIAKNLLQTWLLDQRVSDLALSPHTNRIPNADGATSA